MQEHKIELLSDREHVLLRPARYVGSIKTETTKQWILNKEKNIFEFIDIEYNAGFKKIFREILDNSIDEYVRTKGKFANKLKITINQKKGEMSLEDNGRGIPYSEHKENGKKIVSAELAWTRLKAGSNFKDAADNTTLGQNGEGSSLTNILSHSFIGETCNGEKKVTVNCKENMKEVYTRVTKGTKKFTRVTYKPDLNKFGFEIIPDFLVQGIITDFIILSQVYDKLEITFTHIDQNNKKKVEVFSKKTTSFINLMEMFVEEEVDSEGNTTTTKRQQFEFVEEKGLKIGVCKNSSDTELVFHSINGLVVKSGSPLNWVINSVAKPLVDRLSKRYKTLKPGDVRQKFTWIVLFDGMTNPRFDSQTKDGCVNTYTEFKNSIGDINFTQFGNKIFNKKPILEPLIESYQAKAIVEERKVLKELKPEKKRVFVEKYYKSSGNYNKDKISLVLIEGDSALQGVIDTLGRELYSYFPLKGKPLNVYEESNKKIIQNKEIKSILQILDLDITKDNDTMKYDSVIIATDADPDGQHITGLLISLFNKFTPHLIEQGKIKIFRTPMIVATPKGRGKKVLIYNFEEMFDFEEKYDIKKYDMEYYKGLGRWEDDDLKNLIAEYGIDNFIIPLNRDIELDKLIDNWFSKDKSDFRKDQIRNIKFSIERA